MCVGNQFFFCPQSLCDCPQKTLHSSRDVGVDGAKCSERCCYGIALLSVLFVGACEYMLYVYRIGLRYRYLFDSIVGEPDVHAVAIVAENLYLVLVNDIATVATDEVVAEFVFYGLGGAAQHVIA